MSTDVTREQPVVAGFVSGALAWGIGYVITYLLVANQIRDSAIGAVLQVLEGEPATYKLVGWVFYNAHLVDTVFRNIPLGDRSMSFIGGDGGYSAVLYLLPVGVLVATGLALARYRGAGDPTTGALAGLTAVPGYLLLSLAGAVLFEISIAGVTGGPDLLLAAVIAGLVYPALFAGAGGVIGGLTVPEPETGPDLGR